MHKMLMKVAFAAMILSSTDAGAIESGTLIKEGSGDDEARSHWEKYNCKRPASGAPHWLCWIYNEKLDARKGYWNVPKKTYRVQCDGTPPFNMTHRVLYRRNSNSSGCEMGWASHRDNYWRYQCWNTAPAKHFVYNVYFECKIK